MEIEKDSILTGKVTGITKFGAFVQVAPGRSGLVHISEIANTYVNDVNDFLTQGQEVTVKVLKIDENGRLNLSIKQAQPPAPDRPAPSRPRSTPREESRPAAVHSAEGEVLPPSKDAAFEDKLKKFMQDSDSKMSGVRIYSDNRRGGRRRK